MISLDLSVSGDQLGRALIQDEEELAYCLTAFVEETNDVERLGREVWGYLGFGETPGVVAWLRELADSIEKASK